jgi:hypothetical protein
MTSWQVPVACLLSAWLAGCSSDPGVIVLKNPRTGELVQCRGVEGSNRDSARDAERCARAYEKEGYARISE